MTIPKISEDELQTMVIDTARLYGWRCCHFRAARTDKGWRTPVQGDKGLPDLVLAGCFEPQGLVVGRLFAFSLQFDEQHHAVPCERCVECRRYLTPWWRRALDRIRRRPR